ncbi:YbhB/YbcL family Raf kinase inhibitor-like protein [Pseudomonas phage SRT6]|nr:YbhB/YbcL family Raf kinase inhibitor-like protein [Pseudomonas phage SRT6]
MNNPIACLHAVREVRTRNNTDIGVITEVVGTTRVVFNVDCEQSLRRTTGVVVVVKSSQEVVRRRSLLKANSEGSRLRGVVDASRCVVGSGIHHVSVSVSFNVNDTVFAESAENHALTSCRVSDNNGNIGWRECS